MTTIDGSPSCSPYLYTLSLDCPIPWPANPSYPVRAGDAVVAAAVDSDKGRGGGGAAAKGAAAAASMRTSVVPQYAAAAAAASNNGSRTAGYLLGAPVSEHWRELQRVDDVVADGQPTQEGKAEAEGEDEDEETEKMVQDAPWPDSLHALYLECLYAVREGGARLFRAPVRREAMAMVIADRSQNARNASASASTASRAAENRNRTRPQSQSQPHERRSASPTRTRTQRAALCSRLAARPRAPARHVCA